MTALSDMTNGKLADLIERRKKAAHKAANAVYALAAHGHERYSDIRARLGDDHPVVIAADVALASLYAAEHEAETRTGPQRPSLYPTILRSLPRRRASTRT